MAVVTLDPSKIVDIKYRSGSDGSKTFTFVDSAGNAYTISGNTYTLNIKRTIDDASNVLQLTEGSGLTKNTSSLVITLTDTQTGTLYGDYYWELIRTNGSGLIKRWFNGYLQETKIFDGLTETTSVVIDENGTALTVTISEGISAATQAQVDAGTATGVYVSPSTLSNKDADVDTLTDGATIALTGEKHTLATSRSAITFTNSFIGDGIFLEIVLSATSSTLTFPAGYLCQVGGTASGDNTASLSGTSGDKYVVSIIKVGSKYYVGVMNMKQ